MDDVRIELVNLKKYIIDQPWDVVGLRPHIRKCGALADSILCRVTESLVLDGNIEGEYNLNAYRLMAKPKATEKMG